MYVCMYVCMYIYIPIFTYSSVREGKVLLNITVKPRIFGQGIVPKETASRLFNLVYRKIF